MKKDFTVKHKLNKYLKPLMDPKNKDIKMYPVYCQVIFERQNYLFPSTLKNYYTEIDLVSKEDMAILKNEVDFITNLIHYELQKKGKQFNLRGLGRKYINYRAKTHSYWNDLIRTELKKILRGNKSKYYDVFHYDNVYLDAGILFEATGKLIPELHQMMKFQEVGQEIEILGEYKKLFPETGKEPFIYPAFFHWLSESHYKRLSEKLIKKGKIGEVFINDSISKMNQNIQMATIDVNI